MIQKLRYRLLSVAILFVFVVSFMPVNAQIPELQLWGIWKAPYATLVFYPEGYLYLPMEGSGTGAYQVSGDTITFSGVFSYAGTVDVKSVSHFRIEGNTLYLPDVQFGDNVYERWSGYSPEEIVQCQGAIETQMKVGYIGRVTVTSDHKPTNVRRQPTTKGEKIASFHDNLYFAVVDGPVCSDGYTWFQIRPLYEYEGYIGWVAEGKDYYFIEPAPQMLEALKPLTPVNRVDQSYRCGSTFPTNLYVGSIARVTFLSGFSPLQVYSIPSQTGQDAGRIEEGELIHIDEGPECADGAIWWKVSDSMGGVYGWVPEVTGSPTYFIERVTVDPNDTTAKFDVLLAASPINNHVMAQVPYKLYMSANTSVMVGSMSPNVAYEIVGTNADISMIQVDFNGQRFWACSGSDNYLVFAQRLLPNKILVTDNSSYQCQDTEKLFTSEEMFVQAGATWYKPGQYPHLDVLEATLSTYEVGSTAKSIVDQAMFVTEINPNGIDLICSVITSIDQVQSSPDTNDTVKVGDVACQVFDWGSKILHGEVLTGVPFVMAYMVAHHETYLDPASDWANDKVNQLPLTHLFCRFRPDICVNGPGSK